jgi:DNA-binding NtrC family response regulator
VNILGARLTVKAHGKRRFVVALKYEGETSSRFLVASDLSWRYIEIAKHYTLRGLVEVEMRDWKSYEGWNQLAKQQGEEGSMRFVLLSLLCDHLLLVHSKQFTLLKNKQPGMPVGCLIEHLNTEALVEAIKEIVTDEKPLEAFQEFSKVLYEILPKRQSTKHMAGRDLGRIGPTPSLIYQNAM